MALGQRKRRSWLLSSALYASPILLGLVGSYAGLTRTLVSPYQSAKRLNPAGTAPAASLTPFLNKREGLPTRVTPLNRGRSAPRTVGGARASAGGAKPQVLARSDTPFVSNTGEDDIHPAWDQLGSDFVYSSTVNQAAKILPPPEDDTTTGGATTGTPSQEPPPPPAPTLADVPQYSVFRGSDNRWLTRHTGNQIYPNLDATNNLLVYVASPEAVVPPAPTDTTTDTTTGTTTDTTTGTPTQEPPAVPAAPAALPWTLELIDVNDLPNPEDLTQQAPTLKINVPGVQNVEKPVWSPDGRAFVFAGQSASTGNWDLYYGSVTPQLLLSEWTDDDAASQAAAQPRISIVPITGAPSGLIDPSMPDEVDPVWSPDGQWLAFTRGTVLLHGLAEGETAGGDAPGRILEDVPLAKDARRAYLEYRNTHVWVAPIRSSTSQTGLFSMSLGRPRRITGYSVLQSGTTQPVTAIEYLPAWTPGLGLGFTTNRDDSNGNRLPDGVGTTTSIFSIFNGTEPEAGGAPVTLKATTPNGIDVVIYDQGRNLARKETFSVPVVENSNEEYPSFSPQTPSPAEFNIDLIYQMDLEANPGTPNPPLDPAFFSHDIWRTTSDAGSDNVFDLRALPSVSPRLALPGSIVHIEAAVGPKFEVAGFINVAEVTAIMRDPDQKVFANQGRFLMDNGTRADTIEETGAVTIDSVPLFDDGLPEHSDAAAGDGIYSNNWATPTIARDYYMDLAVRGDATTGGINTGGFAFDYFDNVWGFSTRRFEPRTNLLLVSDHMAGQKFVHARTGNTGLRQYSIYPVESYWTGRPMPEIACQDAECESPLLPVGTWQNVGAVSTSFPAFGADRSSDVLGANSPYGDEYDLWRTQCRDTTVAVPQGGDAGFYASQSLQDAINFYAPRTVSSFTRQGRVTPIKYADRGIAWASPYTGDITEQVLDTIRNPAVQDMLIAFLKKGGRLLLSGEDVAWSLTNNVRLAPNTLLNNYFHVAYLDDADADVILGPGAITAYSNNRHQVNSAGAAITDPVGFETWSSHWTGPDTGAGSVKAWFPNDNWIAPGFVLANANGFDPMSQIHTDGAPNQVLIDGITGTGGTGTGTPTPDNIPGPNGDIPVRVFTYTNKAPFPVGDTPDRDATYIYHNTQSGFKTAYFGFGLEGMHRFYEVDWEASLIFTPNRPAQVMHNSLCWLRQGGISGRVSDVQLGRPIAGAVVLAYIPTLVNGEEQIDVINGAAVTDAQGNYTILGLEASVYRLTVVKPGFVFEHIQHEAVHGGHITTGDTQSNLVMTPVTPGNINVTVVNGSNQPVPNVVVQARLVKELVGSTPTPIENGPIHRGVTGADGKALLQGAEVGIYEVSVLQGNQVVAVRGDIRVQSNKTSSVTLTITGILEPVLVSGKVTDAEGAAVSGIQVIASGATGETATVTDTAGNYSFRLQPGDYTIKAVNGAGVQASQGVTVGASAVVVNLVIGQNNGGGPGPGVTTLSFPAGVSMVSLPESFNGQDFATVLNQAGFKVAIWNPTSEQYALYPNEPARAVAGGSGYFIKLAAPVTVNVPAQTNTGARTLLLKKGWNMIGNPYTVPVPLGNVTVNSKGQAVGIQAAAAAGLIDANVWGLAGAAYQRASVLEPGKGYWILAKEDVTLNVTAPVVASAPRAAARARLAARPSGGGIAESLGEWWADVTRRPSHG